ncbi:MAG: hypothetical protein AB7I50_20185, partial [Vicinamibacterales bacterium]
MPSSERRLGGATVVGAGTGGTINELSLAVDQRQTTSDFAPAILGQRDPAREQRCRRRMADTGRARPHRACRACRRASLVDGPMDDEPQPVALGTTILGLPRPTRRQARVLLAVALGSVLVSFAIDAVLSRYIPLDPVSLRDWLAGHGAYAPLIYML